jgi:hypothetical protein
VPTRRAAAVCANGQIATCTVCRRTIRMSISDRIWASFRMLTNLREYLRTARVQVEKFAAIVHPIINDNP